MFGAEHTCRAFDALVALATWQRTNGGRVRAKMRMKSESAARRSGVGQHPHPGPAASARNCRMVNSRKNRSAIAATFIR